MKEFLALLFRFRLRDLFVRPTTNEVVRLFRYVFVGGVAFLVEFAVFTLTNLWWGDGDLAIAAATAVGFLFGLAVNYALSKAIVFTEKPAGVGAGGEFAAYGLIGLVGMGVKAGLMVLAVRILAKYIAFVVVTAIVLVYNYYARKILLYRGKGGTGS